MYATWRRDILRPYVEYLVMISIILFVVMFVVRAAWYAYLIALVVMLLITSFIVVKVCWRWLEVQEWGIIAHCGFYSIRLDYGTFEVLRVEFNNTMHTYRLIGCAGDLYMKFTVPDDFAGIKFFRSKCVENGVSLKNWEVS